MQSQNSQLNQQQLLNANNNINTVSNNSYALNPEAKTFDILQLSSEQLFDELQNINTQIQCLKYEVDHIIFPTLTQINAYLLMYETNAQYLLLPQNQSQYLLLKQQQSQLQQQHLQNQMQNQQLLQQLKSKRELYHKIKNESYVRPNNIIGHDDDKQNADHDINNDIINETMNETMNETISAPSVETDLHIPLESPSPSQSQSTVSQLIESEELQKESQETPRHEYDVMTLIQLQSQYLSINWGQHKDIPRSIRFISHGVDNEKYMENVVAMFMRKTPNPWTFDSLSTDKEEKLKRKLRGVLNRMTPEKFDKVAAQTMNVVNQFAETKHEMKLIIGIILQFAIEIPVFGNQYAQLCRHLFAHLPKLGMICDYKWVLNDNDLSKTFRQWIIVQTNTLFTKHRNHSPDDIHLDVNGQKITDPEELEIKIIKLKNNFYAVMTLVAELYNVGLISDQVIYKGLFDVLLPPKNITFTAIDIEGLCRLLKRCGKKLDAECKKLVDIYLQKLLSHANKFDFRTQVLVDDVKEMRGNDWKHRIKKDVAKTKKKIREEFEADQAKSHRNKHGRRYHNNYHHHDHHDHHDEYYNIGYDNDYKQHNYNKYSRSTQRNRYNQSLRPSPSRSTRHSRYTDNRSWDDSSQHSNDYDDTRSQYNNDNGSLADSSQNSDDEHSSKSKKMNENESKDDECMKPENKLRSLIDEYLVSGVIDDILDFDCSDFRVWSAVINDGLRDRKSTEIENFIDLMVQLFEHNILNNKSANFVNIVVKHLAIQLDDSSMDCPFITQYIGQLFVKLCYYQYLNIDDVYNYFIQKYREYSQYQSIAQKKTINKIIKYSIEELQKLNGSQKLISKIDRYSM